MHITKKFKLVIFYLLLGMGAGSVAGAPLFPELQPFDEGLIDYVDLKTRTLVVNDVTYRLPDQTQVLNGDGETVSQHSLRPGMAVQLHVDPAALEKAELPMAIRGVELLDGAAE